MLGGELVRARAPPGEGLRDPGGGEDLRAAGAIPAGLLRPSQSLVLLSLLLRLGTPAAGIAETFAQRGTVPD